MCRSVNFPFIFCIMFTCSPVTGEAVKFTKSLSTKSLTISPSDTKVTRAVFSSYDKQMLCQSICDQLATTKSCWPMRVNLCRLVLLYTWSMPSLTIGDSWLFAIPVGAGVISTKVHGMYVFTQKRRQVVRLEMLLSLIVMKLAEFSLVELVSRIRPLMVFDWHSWRINKQNSFCKLKAMFFLYDWWLFPLTYLLYSSVGNNDSNVQHSKHWNRV